MKTFDNNDGVKALMRLRKRFTSRPSAASCTTDSQHSRDRKDFDDVLAAMKKLVEERDEARREVCRDEAIIRLQRHHVHRDSEEVVRMAKEISVERGWDCFKENINA